MFTPEEYTVLDPTVAADMVPALVLVDDAFTAQTWNPNPPSVREPDV
jgi:hypothetical protein